MRLFPAIDIRGGKCVRLYQGDFARETVYGDDPVEQALTWQREGAEALHVVDLDGAREGHAVNGAIIHDLCSAVSIPVQVGGGIRTVEGVRELLERGAWRVVLGSMALREPERLREVLAQYGARIVVALDARDGVLTTDGWLGTTSTTSLCGARALSEAGVTAFIYTNIGRDGTLQGPDLEGLSALRDSIPPEGELIASGGIGRLIEFLQLRARGINAAIVGQALYSGAFTLAEARQALASGTNGAML